MRLVMRPTMSAAATEVSENAACPVKLLIPKSKASPPIRVTEIHATT